MTTQPERLHHLLDRARHGVLLPAEGDQLAGLVTDLEASAEQTAAAIESQASHCLSLEARIVDLEAEVARLTAGQCVDSRRMCEQHHTVPVAGCPYPRCLAARDQTPPEHMPKGTNAEDCPACRVGPAPDYPWICPGPTTA